MVDWIALGLVLDCIGVIFMAIPEYGAATYPLIGKLGDARAKKQGMNELALENQLNCNQTGFSSLISIIEKEIGLDDDIHPTNMTITGRFGAGDIVIVSGEDGRSMTAPPGVLQSWVEKDISRAYLRFGLVLLGVGFGLQLLSRFGVI